MKLNETQKEVWKDYECTEGKTLVLCDWCGLLFCCEDQAVMKERHVCLGCKFGIE